MNNMNNKIKIPTLPDDIINLIIECKEDIEDKEQEFIDEYCHDITASEFMEQGVDEWGDSCICIAGGGEHACYIELNGDKFRYNWPCRKQTQHIADLWIVNTGDGCEYITDKNPNRILSDDRFEQYLI